MYSVAETLLRFLDSLVQPVIPYGLYSQCIDSSSSPTAALKVIEQLPTQHLELFEYIRVFIRNVLLPVNNSLNTDDLCIPDV